MKKIELGQIITILANIGVIAGIVFLGYELRQNNELMAAEIRAARNNRVLGVSAMVASDVGLADLLMRAKNGEMLSEADEFRVISFNVWRLRGQEAFFNEYQAGAVESIPLDEWRRRFNADLYGALQSKTWARTRRYLNEDFAQFMEENVVNR